MQLIRGLHNLVHYQALFAAGSVVTIGNFDGVHVGHQHILKQVHEQALQKQLPSVVMVFEPLPIEFFAPQKAPVRLMNLREKMQAFRDTDIDYVLCVRFNHRFAALTHQAFIRQVLVAGLNIKHLVVGDDFRFGKNRLGDYATLQAAGKEMAFTVTDLPTFEQDQQRVSSTRVRSALATGGAANAKPIEPDLAQAQRLLGKPFGFDGRVIHGQKLGRQLGFRTLNLNPKRPQMPVQGVFAVSVEGIAQTAWPGIANIGIRPTVQGHRPSIEVHLFNWQKDLYGRHVKVHLEKFIRAEMKFADLEQLKAQISKDVQAAKRFFKI